MLAISMIMCMLSQVHGQDRGRVTATAEPDRICEGGSSTLHAEATVTSAIVDFETGDFSQANFNNSGSYPWRITTTNPYEGSYCMKSTCEGIDYGSSSIEATVDVPSDGFMGFYVKVSSEINYDKFHFYIDGLEKGSALSGEVAYAYKEYSVEAGVHTYKWEYKKDVSQASGDDCVYIDYISIFSQNSLTPTLPAEPTYNFNSGFQNWTCIDADGDGYNWKMSNNYGHSGSKCVMSESYSSGHGALSPNNYLVSPRIELGGLVTFYACAYYAYDPAEHFGLAVSTTTNASANAFTTIMEWTMTAKEMSKMDGINGRYGNWYQYTVDLSNYAGQTGYVAIRHFNCYNHWWLYVDDIYFYESPSNPGGGSSGDITFQWNNGMSGPDVTVYPTETTTYTVTATDESGTVIGTAQVTVTVDPQPIVSIEPVNTSICLEDSITLHAVVDVPDFYRPGDILCTDGSIVHPADWTSSMGVQGVVFYVDATGVHGWVVDLGQITEKKKWSTENKTISGLQPYSNWKEAIADFDGLGNTQTIREFGNATKYPAAWAVNFNQGWYLPSIGQLNFLFGELAIVNESLTLVNGAAILAQDGNEIWSSSACSDNRYAMMLWTRMGRVGFNKKTNTRYVRAVKNF